MSSKASTTQHLIRQRSPLTLAAVCGVTGLVLLVATAWHWADNPQPLFVAWVLLVMAVVWALFARPAVILDEDGLTLRNVFRDVQIPWARVTDVESRWNLRVFVGECVYTAWAISSQVERPKGVAGGMFAMLPGRLDKFATSQVAPPSPAAKVTARTVARSIEQAKEEYAEALTMGKAVAAPDGQVQITWVPTTVAIVLLPAIAVVVLSLT
jgi:hypothetical protein